VILLRHLAHLLLPVFLPLYRCLALGEGWLGIRLRSVLIERNQRLLDRHGPASLADFDRRAADLTPEDVCLDLGANMGIFTEKLAATGAQVHAYEPDPHCFAALERRFAGRENVHLHQQAVAEAAGQFLLRRTRDFLSDPDAQSTSSSIAVASPTIYDEENAVIVETVAFHDVVRGFGRPVALIKMDIEGAEFDILDRILRDRAKGVELPIGALFVETHERHFPRRFGMVAGLRQASAQEGAAYPIDTYWP
jgi:FkbM family methyltransferase